MAKSSCCTFCGFLSMLGAIFYCILAIMVFRRNVVFLEHKLGMDQFTWTDAEINQKFWQIMWAAIVSRRRTINVIGYGHQHDPLLDKRVLPQEAGRQAFRGTAVRAGRAGSDRVRPLDRARGGNGGN